MSARLYGNITGHSSLATVTDGFRQVLLGEGLLAGEYGVDAPDLIDAGDPAEGVMAPWGIYTGSLSHVQAIFTRGRHQHQAIMIAPNSTELPRDLVRLLTVFHHKHDARFMAPSRWAADIVSQHLKEPCLVVPHGVGRQFRVDDEAAATNGYDYNEGRFRVLHFSTSARQRKGTFELLLAWKILKARMEGGHIRPELLCVMDFAAEQRLREELLDAEMDLPPDVRIAARAELSPAAMARNLGRSHLVCQPSRGEAFGLVPLEALACGVPVVATDCTGHSEYLSVMTPGVEVIPTGGLAHIDDLPSALAPTLSPGAIAKHLEIAICAWPEHQRRALGNASEIQKLWSWEEKLAPLVACLKETAPW